MSTVKEPLCVVQRYYDNFIARFNGSTIRRPTLFVNSLTVHNKQYNMIFRTVKVVKAFYKPCAFVIIPQCFYGNCMFIHSHRTSLSVKCLSNFYFIIRFHTFRHKGASLLQ